MAMVQTVKISSMASQSTTITLTTAEPAAVIHAQQLFPLGLRTTSIIITTLVVAKANTVLRTAAPTRLQRPLQQTPQMASGFCKSPTITRFPLSLIPVLWLHGLFSFTVRLLFFLSFSFFFSINFGPSFFQMAALELLVVQMVCAQPLDGVRVSTHANATLATQERPAPLQAILAQAVPAPVPPPAPIPALECTLAPATLATLAVEPHALVSFPCLFVCLFGWLFFTKNNLYFFLCQRSTTAPVATIAPPLPLALTPALGHFLVLVTQGILEVARRAPISTSVLQAPQTVPVEPQPAPTLLGRTLAPVKRVTLAMG